MISNDNGSLTINKYKTVLNGTLTKEEFENSELFMEVLNFQIYGYTNYYLNPQTIDDSKFIIVLYFNKSDVLEYVKLGMLYNGNMPSWNNCSEVEELKRKDAHDKWLLMHIGKPPYKYNWGEVSSNYDPRSVSSMITIRYYKA